MLLINCANLRFGGGKTVGMNIINYFKSRQEQLPYRIVVIAPFNCGYEAFEGGRIQVEVIPEKYNKPWFKYYLNNKVLPGLAQKYKAGYILSLGNIAFPARVPQSLLIHLAYIVYPESPVWKRLSLKHRLLLRTMVGFIKRNLKNADHVLLQTQTMVSRFLKLYPFTGSQVGIMPNGVSFTSISDVAPLDLSTPLKEVKLLFFSKHYPHKNFDILIPLAQLIKSKDVAIKFTVTLDRSESSAAAQFLDEVQRLGLDTVIHNAGHINFDQIPALYEAHQGLFLPTLLESFSGTYIEAMHFGRPVFTSNMDFATEVCKEAAYYFNPTDVNDIFAAITHAFAERGAMADKIEKARLLCNELKSWEQIGQELEAFLETKVK
ncbi:glycosyltransferase involved in cell wall biosynthesis [Taibaiella chishuiensis]|uniref:Glycosyltransferase involved in cell wall biosynthesis n=2 Tax=Taibaiella chishuiensis TaxID=1434707 RepID=A0A2P8DB75_9BACT|nr:glycosyltransferase involved in cell wall biosynthesis [Taibaiella chishuiensis]